MMLVETPCTTWHGPVESRHRARGQPPARGGRSGAGRGSAL